MIVLGIAHDIFISSAALVRDGQVVAAIAEERLNRQKQYKGFPAMAVKECLRLAGCGLDDLDHIAVGWNPTRHLEFANYRQSNNARFRGEYLYALPNMVLGHFRRPSGSWIEQRLESLKCPIVYSDHHLAHAANAFYLSGYEKAAYLTADGIGERATTSWGTVDRKEGIKKVGEIMSPHSLGLFYGAVTQFLGFRPDSDEWKVMALASYGTPNNEYTEFMKSLVQPRPSGIGFTIDQRYFSFATPESTGGKFFTELFVEKCGAARTANDPIEQRHHDVAWAAQHAFEEGMTRLLTQIHGLGAGDHVVASGGCMMNSVYNGKITTATPFKRCFISSCPDDSGIAVGAALLGYFGREKAPKFPEHRDNYWGPAFDDQIDETLKGFKLKSEKVADPAEVAATMLTEGKLVGWYQGRMEFGQRALGNRSILADARNPKVRDIINAAVKFRESFRPFAPAILREDADAWFKTGDADGVPYMEKVYLFKDEVKSKVPGVVHVDGTGRLQTVEKEANPKFYALISAFKKLTGVPLILNTSFNLNGEAIVCTPADAIRTFYSCGLDALILGDRLLTK